MKRSGYLAPLLLLFSALLPSKALTTAADACADIGAAFRAGKVVPIKSALACVYSFPYESRRSAAIVDTLYNTFQLHAYKDISIKSPTPEFDVNIDVLGSLREINRTIYHNDFEFNHAVFSVINALKDAHAVYFPQCYVQTLASSTAFPLVKILNPTGTGELVKISSFGKHTYLYEASLRGLCDYTATSSVRHNTFFTFPNNFQSECTLSRFLDRFLVMMHTSDEVFVLLAYASACTLFTVICRS